MRILFLCGSLEPAKDGVGDYVRSLAEACIALGHECRAIALNDPFVAEPTEMSEPMGEGKFTSLRLPRTLSWFQRIKRGVPFRDSFQPDWISFQFVAYGLHDKGLVWKIVPHFQKLLAGARVHIMFHELWIGLPPRAPFKHRLVGPLQCIGIQRLCAAIKPALVTTSNPLYVAALKTIKVHAALLPLYGNIPVADRGRNPVFPGWLGDIGITPANRDEWWLGLFFGGLYSEWKPEPLFALLQRAAKTAGKKICLVSLGRIGAVGEGIWEDLKETYPGISFPVLGEQPVEVVSILMQTADFGIAASPWELIGKSGSATAMLEHGLPVVVSREDRQARFPVPDATDPLYHRVNAALESQLIEGLPKAAPSPRRNEIAAQFCAMLE